jgi:UDP-N-acetylglucosamine 2-epimerase (non-hydrolysing)
MKVAPIISEINKYNKKFSDTSGDIQHLLVHTGQHYDEIMSEVFFEQLSIPKPDFHLGVGSASHAEQTAKIMKLFEGIVLNEKPDLVIVAGDVNSTLACSLVASKISYDVNGGRPLIAHIEAGLRSFDRTMPEEVNRVLTDHISDLLFVTEESGLKNLKNEGISEDKIHFVGNTMIDTLLAFQEKANESKILEILRLKNVKNQTLPYALVTLHRPSNVDNEQTFMNIIEALQVISGYFPVILPAHPRTQKKIKEFGLEKHFNFPELELPGQKKNRANAKITGDRIHLTNPLSYLDFLCLMSNAWIVLTDSGGIQEETTCLGVPCITIRENTERPVTVTQGTNILAGVSKDKIIKAFEYQCKRKIKKSIPKFWDGKAAQRIIRIIVNKPN